jgi:glycosyltransferase involved in cell wall biosynthesis
VKKALTNAALIHVTGETPKRIVERLAPLDCQVKVQYWGVDLDAFQPHPKPRSPKSFTIGTASSLEKIYGIDRIILAFSRLVDVVTQEQNVMNLPKPDIRLRIAGDGPEMQYLSLMADDLGISDRVDFIGREKHEFMPSFYNSLDLYVSAFTDDRAGSAFGVSATEAMACGIPLLIERRADTEELLSDLAFIMYKGDNELTDQMIALYDSAERRAALATRGRMLAEKSFDWRKNMANWKAIYDEWTKLYINADNHMTE